MSNATTAERFLSRVKLQPNGCWEWQGCLSDGGYGRFWCQEGVAPAHHFLYELILGAIPQGFELDHLCKNCKCVNPDHLEVVTHRENVQRGLFPELARQRQLSKTHCPYGHPYDRVNTYIKPNGKERDCRTCRKRRQKEYIARKKENN